MDDDKQIIEEAEVVEETQSTASEGAVPPAPTAFDINAYNATLEVVRRRLVIIEKSKEEFKKLKEMHDDAFTNDATYNAADKIVKEATNKRKEIMTQLSKQPGVAETIGKMRDLKDQIKSNEESLADELMEYYRTAGVTEIEDENGNVQEFVISIRLKPKVKVG